MALPAAGAAMFSVPFVMFAGIASAPMAVTLPIAFLAVFAHASHAQEASQDMTAPGAVASSVLTGGVFRAPGAASPPVASASREGGTVRACGARFIPAAEHQVAELLVMQGAGFAVAVIGACRLGAGAFFLVFVVFFVHNIFLEI